MSPISSRIGLMCCALWTALAIVWFSDSGTQSLHIAGAVYFAFAWLVFWATRLIWFLLRLKRGENVGVPRAQLKASWSVEPVVCLVVALLAYCNALMLARFYLSLPALDRYANEVRAGRVNVDFEFTHEDRWVAFYSVTITDKLPNSGVRFITSSDGILGSAGFASFPNGKPDAMGENSYTHITGSWWRWEQSF